MKENGVSNYLNLEKGPFREMIQRGLIVFLDNADFGGRSKRVRIVPIRDLRELWELVECNVREGDARELPDDVVSPRQRDEIRTAFNALYHHLISDEPRRPGPEDYAQINDRDLFVWSWEDGGFWKAALETAREALKEKSRTQRYTGVGAMRNALDLAYEHGRLMKPDPEEALELPPTEGWMAFDRAWEGPFDPNELNGQRSRAARVILEAALRVVGPDCVDPVHAIREGTDEILEVLDSEVRAGGCRSETGTAIRKILRRAYEEDLVAPTDEDALDAGLADIADTVLPFSKSREIANAQTRRWEDRKKIRARPGIPLLAEPTEENPYTLSYCLDYFTATPLVRRDAGLPDFGVFPTTRMPRNTDAHPSMWARSATVESKLRHISQFVELCRHYNPGKYIDDATLRLTDLLTMDNVRKLAGEASENGRYTPYQVERVAITLGQIASPCLEMLAHMRGDDEARERFHAISAACSGHGYVEGRERVRSIVDRMRSADHALNPPTSERARAEEAELAWRRCFPGEEYSYRCRRQIEDAAERSLLRDLAIERWEDFTLDVAQRQTLSILREVQGLGLWREIRSIPFRRNTLRQLSLQERYPDIHKGRERIRYRVPARKMKSGQKGSSTRDFSALVSLDHDEGLMDAILRIVRPLLLRKSPVIDQGLRVGWTDHPDYPDTGELWVGNVSHPQVKVLTMGDSVLNDRLRGVLDRGCKELEIDPEPLAPYVTTHYARHSLGSFFVNHEERSRTAALLLHHVGTTMVDRVYSAPERNASADVTSESKGESRPQRVEELEERNKQLEERNKQLAAENKAIWRRLAELEAREAA